MKKLLVAAALWALALFLIAPFVWMVLVSLQPPRSPIPEYTELWPKQPHWSNYRLVIFNPFVPMGRFFMNSLLVAACIVVGQLLLGSMAAFAMTRIRFRGADALFYTYLGSMMFAGVVTQIPVYMMLRDLRWLDTFLALIIPGISSAFTVFLLRQFMFTIPRELDEAAAIDGAGYGRIYANVILPLCRPALATAGAFAFFAVWTDFFWPLLVTNSMRMRTLEVGLSVFKNSYGETNWPLQMAAATVTLIPVTAAFLFAQRWFVRGIQMSGIK